MNPTLRNWLELTRISNLPTVLSSSLVGTFMVTPLIWDPTMLFGTVLTVVIAIACFYVGGFVMNDVFDIEIDRAERPGRPLPSGRISLPSAARFGMLLLCSGMVLLVISELVSANSGRSSDGFSIRFPFGWIAGGLLVALVLLYDRFHDRNPWWVFAMAGCRALVYVTCLLVVSDQLIGADSQPLFMMYVGWPNIISLPVVPFILAMFVYVAGFSRLARGEVASEGGQGGRFLRYACLASTFVPVAVLLAVKLLGGVSAVMKNRGGVFDSSQLQSELLINVVSCGVAALWFLLAARSYCVNPGSPRKPIQMWIAGIALLDGLYLFLYGQWMISLACFLLFLFTILGHRRIKGT